MTKKQMVTIFYCSVLVGLSISQNAPKAVLLDTGSEHEVLLICPVNRPILLYLFLFVKTV